MKSGLIARFAAAAIITSCVTGCSSLVPCPYKGTSIVASSLKSNTFSIAFILEPPKDAPENIVQRTMAYHGFLATAFLRNGYKVVERVHTLPFDSNTTAGADFSVSPASTRKIGELYAVTHIGLVNVLKDGVIFRIIDCENAETAAVCTFSYDNYLRDVIDNQGLSFVPSDTEFNLFATDSADLFAISLQYAVKEKNKKGYQSVVYLDVNMRPKLEIVQGEKKILYSRRICSGSYVRYAYIYTINED